jgi:hypothetical protein
MDGLRNVVGGLNQLGFRLEVWVNGSFLTQKINPEDSDVAVRFQGEDFDAAPPAQQRQFHQYVNMDFKAVHKCDLYAFPEYNAGHALYDYGQWRKAYWLNKFGYSRAEDPKGLAVISIPYLVTP